MEEKPRKPQKGRTEAEALYIANLARRKYLNDDQAAAYVGLSKSAFRAWAKRIDCRRRLDTGGGRGRIVNIRELIDKAIMEAKD